MNWHNSSTDPCAERRRRWLTAAAAVLLAGCAPPRRSDPEPAPAAPAGPAPVIPPPPPAVQPPMAPSVATPRPRQPRRVQLPPPAAVRNQAQLREQLAKRLVAMHPEETYLSKPPEILLAVPVLLIELRADGAVRRVQVLRWPSDKSTHDTVQLAIDAVHRAGPYASPQGLPQPWSFTESFLFDAQRRFKPRSLD